LRRIPDGRQLFPRTAVDHHPEGNIDLATQFAGAERRQLSLYAKAYVPLGRGLMESKG